MPASQTPPGTYDDVHLCLPLQAVHSMATKLWGSLVGRRGSSAEPLDLDEIDQDNHAAPPRR